MNNNNETVTPWEVRGVSEKELTRSAVEIFRERVQRQRLLAPLLHKAEKRVKHFQMDAVVDMICDIREEYWTIRQNTYRELISRHNDDNLSFYDAKKLIDEFGYAVGLRGSGAWICVIDAINTRISEPQINDTTLQTITVEEIIKESESKDEDKDEDEDACCVCLDDFAENEKLQKCPGCKKCIHVNCILRWLKNKHTCPLCRHNLIQNTAAFKRMTYKMYF